jgi:hypothetical protein
MTEEAHRHMKRAEEFLHVAKENLQNEHPSDCVSRSYYAIFHAATAVLKLLGIERKSHHALWSAFGEQVAARGLMDSELHRIALDAFSARSLSDYLAEPLDSNEDAVAALKSAQRFVDACSDFVVKQAGG